MNNAQKIVNFGQHRGLTFEELRAECAKYAQWIVSTDGFRNQPELKKYLIDAGIQPTAIAASSSFTPDENWSTYTDHNQYQATFTDQNKILRIVNDVIGENFNHTITQTIFEDCCNADIVIEAQSKGVNWFSWFSWSSFFSSTHSILVELKPDVGDEYPAILRQMRAQKRAYESTIDKTIPRFFIHQALVTPKYTGKIPLETVQKVFGDIRILEIE